MEHRPLELTNGLPAPVPPSTGYGPLVRSFGRSHQGRVRNSNEDNFLIAELGRMLWVHQTSLPRPEVQFGNRRGHLFLIADGMGGHEGGEVASALTVSTIERFMLDVFRRAEDFPTALRQAHARILEEVALNPEVSGMGTTLTMAVCNLWKLFVVHAGDSRCYLFRGDELKQLTMDHTVVGEMIRVGILSPEEAVDHVYRHVVTNVVGGGRAHVDVDVHELDLQGDDVLLLCTDGLTDMLSADRIAAVLDCEREPQAACNRLVEEALENGGRDNVTVIVTHFSAPVFT
jgi:serine/threonine protein phosphatase PrpC